MSIKGRLPRLQEWETLLQEVTCSTQIHVKAPKKNKMIKMIGERCQD